MTQRFTMSQRISKWTNELDKILNHVLGYLLAFTGLIAVADVIGNQRMSSTAPVLFWTWIFVQGLGIDFQILTLIRRLPKLWSNKPVFWANIVFIILLFLMLVIIGSVFVEHDTTTTSSIEAAMKALGFPHWLFVWLRSILSALLIVIFGIDRALETHEHEQREATLLQTMLPPNVLTREHLQTTVTELRNELLAEIRSHLQGSSEPNMTTGTSLDSSITTSRSTEQERNELREKATIVHISPAHIPSIHLKGHSDLLFVKGLSKSHSVPPQQQKHSQRRKRSLKAEKVYQFLKTQPVATLEDIERAVGVKRSYASELRTKLRSEIEAEEQKHSSSEPMVSEREE